MKKKKILIFGIISILCLPIVTQAKTAIPILACENTLLGSTANQKSVAWLIQEVLNIIKVVGPILVAVLSGVEFVQVIAKGDDEAMGKAQKKLVTRLILIALLFLLPVIVETLLKIFGLMTDSVCGLN
ncbi:MAG: hypothetical protein IJI60_04425 [Bacilli bacterium]|nr:hypothetical protein [Bacilli bacterium]